MTRLMVDSLIDWRRGAAMDARPVCLKTDSSRIAESHLYNKTERSVYLMGPKSMVRQRYVIGSMSRARVVGS